MIVCAGTIYFYNNPEKLDSDFKTTVRNVVSPKKLEEVNAPEIGRGEYGTKAIVGSFKNVTGSKISYAQVTFALFDKDGAQVGTAIANINDLAEDAVWKYSAVPLTMDNWVSFELTEITAW